MANVLITSEFFGKFSKEGKEIIINEGHNVMDNPYGHKFLSPHEIIPHIGNAKAIICDLEKINKDVIDSAPNLKIIARRGVGVDSVDVDYAAEKGIKVVRTLNVVEAPVAELVMGYILEFSRNISKLNADMHNGLWKKKECHSIDGKTLGIVGMGKIAYEVARRAKAFNMNIIYFDINRNEKVEEDTGAGQRDFEVLIKEADFISIHTPLTPSTENLFTYEVISKMKKTAYLINTARGQIINQDGLYKALKENKIEGAAIDVFEKEPEGNSILKEFNNVLLTPHVGTFTQEIFIKMDILAAKNIVEFFK